MSEPAATPADLEAEPAVATELFGPRLPLARRYAALLAGDGVTRGLVGPREPGRIWSRHVVNSALLALALPSAPVAAGAVEPGVRTVVDLGSGAGLPGIPLALARPDLAVSLVEPLERRVRFLREAVDALGVAVEVVHARAEDLCAEDLGARSWDAAVARALAPVQRLVPLAAAVVRPGGRLVALKGATVGEEIASARSVLERHSSQEVVVDTVGTPPWSATVVTVVLDREARDRPPSRRTSRGSRP